MYNSSCETVALALSTTMGGIKIVLVRSPSTYINCFNACVSIDIIILFVLLCHKMGIESTQIHKDLQPNIEFII